MNGLKSCHLANSNDIQCVFCDYFADLTYFLTTETKTPNNYMIFPEILNNGIKMATFLNVVFTSAHSLELHTYVKTFPWTLQRNVDNLIGKMDHRQWYKKGRIGENCQHV